MSEDCISGTVQTAKLEDVLTMKSMGGSVDHKLAELSALRTFGTVMHYFDRVTI